MKVRVFGVVRGNQTIDMIKLIRNAGELGLKTAKDSVDDLLCGRVEEFTIDCRSLAPEIVVEKIASVGFLAEVLSDS